MFIYIKCLSDEANRASKSKRVSKKFKMTTNYVLAI